jgi:hypothetical protein
MAEKTNAYRIFVGKLEEITRNTKMYGMDNIKMDLGGRGWGGMD